jgi:glucose/arabinose dehydrogenase
MIRSFSAPSHVWAAAATTALLLLFPAGAKAQQPQLEKTEDYQLRVETLALLDGEPWSIAFIDADHALVTEKGGRLRTMVKGKIQPESVRDTPAVDSRGQGGLLGIAVDPNYAKEPWVYLSYSYSPNNDGAAMTRIVRGKIQNNSWTDQQVLWEAKPEHYRKAGVHFGCRIVFDKKGHLYFAMGDRGSQNQAQDPTLPNGKHFRINRDGSIPKDNPFLSNPQAYPAIYSIGNRNPQGLAIHPVTDQLWSTEHGPRGGDELNLIQAGKNYGWPVITYGINYSGTKITDITEKEGMEQPVKYWVPSPAFCGLTFVTAPLFPKWQNNLLAGCLAGQHIKRLTLKDNKVVGEERIFANKGRIRDVQTGPDGAIYVLVNGPNQVLRLTPNTPSAPAQ